MELRARSPRGAAAQLGAPPAAWLLQDLPAELLQGVLDLVPDFGGRARACRACAALARLDWRRGPPRRLDDDLTGMCLGDSGAAAVARALQLPWRGAPMELCLGSNGIGDAGACALARALASGAAVRRLSLHDNRIGDIGAMALADALGQNGTIEELDIWGNWLTAAGKGAVSSLACCEVFLEAEPPLRLAATTPSAANAKMRSVLFEWISQVHGGALGPPAAEKLHDPQDVLFRTYGHVDSYISRRAVRRSELQLVGIACTLLARGLGAHSAGESEEIASWLAFVTDGACTVTEVHAMLVEVQGALGFCQHQPTVYTFLRRFLRRIGWTQQSFSLANYLIELAATDAAFRMFQPQAVAAAASILSRQYRAHGVAVRRSTGWKARLLRYARVDLDTELAACTAALARLHASEQCKPQKFVNRKYSWARLHMVARIQPNPPGDASFFSAYMSS